MKPSRLPTLLLALMLAPAAQASETYGKVVLQGDLRAAIDGAGGGQECGGRLSGILTFAADAPQRGFEVQELNVVLFGVPQHLITGRHPEGKPTGSVDFMPDAGGQHRLAYDPRSHSLTGTITGTVGAAQLLELGYYEVDPKADEVESPTLRATVHVGIDLGEGFDLEAARKEVAQLKAKVELKAEVHDSDAMDIRAFAWDASSSYILADYTILPLIEFSRRLCLQPVRIARLIHLPGFFFFLFSGDGLAFGLPGANTEWAKADVVFTVRDWITLYSSQYSTLTQAEEAALLAEVDEDDCIEIFFPDKFSPSSLHGGGVTYNGGRSYSKVISSDENADFGIDLTHLAHELGHVMTLKHPGAGFPNASAPHRVDASTGTLLCPSGFMNDNPQVNSVWNENNVANPLFTFTLKLVSPGPDCINDADCGPCP